jgi:hypothetical protein
MSETAVSQFVGRDHLLTSFGKAFPHLFLLLSNANQEELERQGVEV